ncbi:bifunctional phosphoglucose/phosphomannose isomerase [Metallosphaera tengchongensis]|uniref:Bifunctional phosphoglucose/phosphomannose isomerase n=2 Tax=Metallosphaera tengchongensis TaxID=1532350 RepID=A0A6N0NVS8_9CREN|nr:bifunctional phosphoglucose/phosphomannose isomerase [Metallosphaera tengchongensis]
MGLTVPSLAGKVSCTGMGGSGVVCEVVKAFYPLRTDDPDVLIAVSYSGNTWETVERAKQAMSQGIRVVAVTSGGELSKLTREVILVKQGNQPRYSFPYLFLPVVKMLRPDLIPEVVSGVDNARAVEVAKELLDFIGGRIPVFYGSKYLGVAKRFKQEINENAKYPAFFGEIPEVNHNEVESYTHGEGIAPIVLVGSEIDQVTAELINAFVLKVTGMRDVSFLIQVAGFLSVELAKKLGEDPSKLTKIPEGKRLAQRIGR